MDVNSLISKLLVTIVLLELSLCCSCCLGRIFVVDSLTNTTVENMSDIPARFGADIPITGIQGLLVRSKPSNACEAVLPPPAWSNFTGSWILLVKRYNCTFMDKVAFAQSAGYDAVIVYNIHSNGLEPMGPDNRHDPKNITIPSVFIGYDDGKILNNYFTYERGFYLEITDSLPFDIQSYILPFAITIGVCFVLLLGFMTMKCIRDYRQSRRHRLSSRALKKLPIHKFKKGDPYDCCAVCLDDYVDNDTLRILPCSHAYHVKCIDPWLTKSRRVCPVCKRVVLTGDERPSDFESETDDETSPLINSEGGTQGGTFAPQRENPFQESQREANRRQRRSSRGRSSSGYQVLEDSSSSSSSYEDAHDGGNHRQSRETSSRKPSNTNRSRLQTRRSRVVAAVSLDDDEQTNVAIQQDQNRKNKHDSASLGSPDTNAAGEESTNIRPSSLPSGPVQIAVDVVNSSSCSSSSSEQESLLNANVVTTENDDNSGGTYVV